MSPKFQVVVTDPKDYIIEYGDFRIDDEEKLKNYVWAQLTRSTVVKVTIRRWNW